MPGMTANITIVTDRRDNVIRIPTRALAFTPRRASSANNPSHGWRGSPIWIDDGGKLRPVRITRGLDDGNYVEVVEGDIKPGDLVVIDSKRPEGAQAGHPFTAAMRLPHM